MSPGQGASFLPWSLEVGWDLTSTGDRTHLRHFDVTQAVELAQRALLLVPRIAASRHFCRPTADRRRGPDGAGGGRRPFEAEIEPEELVYAAVKVQVEVPLEVTQACGQRRQCGTSVQFMAGLP